MWTGIFVPYDMCVWKLSDTLSLPICQNGHQNISVCRRHMKGNWNWDKTLHQHLRFGGRLRFELGWNLILKILTSTGYFSSSMLCNLLVNHLLLSLYIIYISYITSNIHMIFKIKQYFHYRSVLHTNDINKWNFRTEILMWIKPMKGFCWYLMAMKVVLIMCKLKTLRRKWEGDYCFQRQYQRQ